MAVHEYYIICCLLEIFLSTLYFVRNVISLRVYWDYCQTESIVKQIACLAVSRCIVRCLKHDKDL